MRALLIGPAMEGGEGAYVNSLRTNPPPAVVYSAAGGFHSGAPGAPCSRAVEIALNRIVRPVAVPDLGFRALRLRDRFDLVHVHAHPVRLGNLGRTPLVMSEGSSSAVYLVDYLGWAPERLASAYRRTRRVYRLLGLHDRLLAMGQVGRAYVFSEWARQLNLRWGADPDKLEVLAPGFPTPPAHNRRERGTFCFLFVGTDFERKGGFDVVEAFERVSAEHPRARLVLVGSDPWERNPDSLVRGWVGDARRRRVLEKLEDLERRGLAEHHGLVGTQAVTTSFYPHADAFVMPTLAEGFGFTNVEAMSHALPVVSSLVGPIPEVVAHERTGLLVAPGDVSALAAVMGRLASDGGVARAMGEAGREAFLRGYTVEAFRARLGALYRRALES